MKNSVINKRVLLAAIVAVVAIVAGVCVRIWFARNYVETETMFINLDAPKLLYNFMLCLIGAVGCATVYFLTAKETAGFDTIQNTPFKVKNFLTRIIEFILALLFTVILISYLFDFSSVGGAGYASGSVALPIAKAAQILKLVLCPLAVVFWLLLTFGSGKKLTAVALLSNAPSLWFAMSLLVYFVETSSYVNRFGRNMEVMCYIISIVFLLNETRAYFTDKVGTEQDDEEQRLDLRIYSVLAFCAAYACFLKASVCFDTAFMNVESAELVIRMGLDSGMERTVMICFGCYAFSKLLGSLMAEKSES